METGLGVPAGLSDMRDTVTGAPTVVMAARAWRVIVRETSAASSSGNETGGILLGTTTPAAVTVAHAGSPGPRAVATPTTFLRDTEHSQRFANACYEADGSVWIGEWHTHPGGEPAPSPRDLDTYLTLLADSQLQFGEFISVILAPVSSSSGVVAAAWWCTSDTITLSRLRVDPQNGA